jgi:hypothetical protein
MTDKIPLHGKEGAETDIEVIAANLENPSYRHHRREEYPLTEAESKKYTKIQRDYLEFLIEYGFPIPKDKQQMFRIMILKDYFS